MKITTSFFAAAGLAVAGAIAGVATASAESAPDVTTAEIGEQAKLQNGDVVQGWTITDLKPSSDEIPYEVQGTLWEATATDEAIQGTVIPIVSNLNARSADGENYRVLFQVPTPQGVNPEALAEGEKTTGKVYFDVTGQPPESVVYNDGEKDLVVWVKPEESTGTGQSSAAQTSTRPAPASSGSSSTDAESDTESDTESDAADEATEGAEADAAAVPAGSSGTPLPAGSSGTPLNADTQAAEGAQATAEDAEGAEAATTEGAEGAESSAEGAEGAEGEATPSTGGVAAAPVPAGSSGTPLPDAAARPAGQGTPLPDAPHGPGAHNAEAAEAPAPGESTREAAPTTTPVPAPAS